MQLSQKYIDTENMSECNQTTVPALEAIRGHRSAWLKRHGVIAGQSGVKTYTFFCHRAGDSRTLHFTLRVHDDTGVILKVEENTILSPPRFSLPHNDGGHRCKYAGIGITDIKAIKRYALFFLNSGFPFFTDATTISPTPASGSLLRWDPNPKGSIM